MRLIFVIARIIFGIWVIIKFMPYILKFFKYSILATPLWLYLHYSIPGRIDEIGLALLLLVIAIVRVYNADNSGGSYSPGYVLNKKSGVIHRDWDDSVNTISERHKKVLSFSEAQNLVNRGTRYRYKK